MAAGSTPRRVPPAGPAAAPAGDAMTTLVSRNVTLAGRRTSLRLERAMWDALEEIRTRERQSMHDLCAYIDRTRAERTLTAGIRVYILEYFRRAATEDGHVEAGHGTFDRAG